MTTARVTQTGFEVAREEDQVSARVTQTGFEVARQEDQVKAILTQAGFEVARRNYPEGLPSGFRLVCPTGG